MGFQVQDLSSSPFFDIKMVPERSVLFYSSEVSPCQSIHLEIEPEVWEEEYAQTPHLSDW